MILLGYLIIAIIIVSAVPIAFIKCKISNLIRNKISSPI